MIHINIDELEFDNSNNMMHYLVSYLKPIHMEHFIPKCIITKKPNMGHHAVLILYSDTHGFNRTIFYTPHNNKFHPALYRFAPHLYSSDVKNLVILYGEVTSSEFSVYAVRCGSGSNNIVDNLEWFDQILFNHYIEDLDLEPRKIYIKEFITHQQKDNIYIPATIHSIIA